MVTLPAGSSLGRYQILEGIGRGGMASVFKAHDPELDRHVAVKVLPSYHTEDPTFIERFRREAQAVARLRHRNIVQVHDFGDDKGFTYIVMEYLAGGTLQDSLGQRLPLSKVVELIAPLAEALEFAHSQGVVHRDIKPSNVLMDDARPVLSDFGLARLLEGAEGLTRADTVLGTPEYMAPEQALGRPADQSDMYALAIIIYQMLLGRTPFRGETPSETLMAHVHQSLPLPSSLDPDVDKRLEANLVKALAKDPADRHDSPTDLMRAVAGESQAPRPSPMVDSQPTVESMAPPPVKDGGGKPEEVGETGGTRISLDQAQVLAIRHARENKEFYGSRHSKPDLVWEVLASEEGDDYYNVRLSYRPAGRFIGQPGEELFTIDKAGRIELRQLLNEPERRISSGVTAVAVGLLIVVFGVVGALIFTGGFDRESPRDQPAKDPESLASVPPGTVRVSVQPDQPSKLMSPDSEVEVDLSVGSVSSEVQVWYQPLPIDRVPSMPAGFAVTSRVFDLSATQAQGAATGEVTFLKPVTLTIRLSAQDAWDADGVTANVVIQRYDESAGQWVPLSTTVDFRASIAQAWVDNPSIFALTIKKPAPDPTSP